MATPLYLRNTTNWPPVVNNLGILVDAGPSGGFSTDRYGALPTAGTAGNGTTTSGDGSSTQGTNGILLIRYLSNPVAAAFTLSGTVTFNLFAYETSMTLNAGLRVRVVKMSPPFYYTSITPVCNSLRGTELGTTYAVQNWTVTPTSTAFAIGDLIGIEVYMDDTGGTLTPPGQVWMQYNADTTYLSYVQFTENITFLTSSPTGSVLYLTNTKGTYGTDDDVMQVDGTAPGADMNFVKLLSASTTASEQWTKTSGGGVIEWATPKLNAKTIPAGLITLENTYMVATTGDYIGAGFVHLYRSGNMAIPICGTRVADTNGALRASWGNTSLTMSHPGFTLAQDERLVLRTYIQGYMSLAGAQPFGSTVNAVKSGGQTATMTTGPSKWKITLNDTVTVAFTGPSGSGSATATHTVSATKGLIGHTGSDTEKSTHVINVSHRSNRIAAPVGVVSTSLLAATGGKPITFGSGSGSATATHTVSQASKRGGIGSDTETSTHTVTQAFKPGHRGSDSEVSVSVVSATSKRGGRGADTEVSTHTLSVAFKPTHYGSDTEVSTSTVSATGSKPSAAEGIGLATSTSTVSASFKPGHFGAAGTITSTNTVSASGRRTAAKSGGTVTSTHTVSQSFKPGHIQISPPVLSSHTISVTSRRIAAKSAGTTTSTHTLSVSHKSHRVETAPAVVATSSVTVFGYKPGLGQGAGLAVSTNTVSASFKPGHIETAPVVKSTSTVSATGRRSAVRSAGTTTSTHTISAFFKPWHYGYATTVRSSTTVTATGKTGRKSSVSITSISMVSATGGVPLNIFVINDADKVYLGSIPAIKVYAGTTLVWS